MLGVLTSVTGILLGTELGRNDPALTGFVVFLGFVFDRRRPAHRPPVAAAAVAAGACVALIIAAGPDRLGGARPGPGAAAGRRGRGRARHRQRGQRGPARDRDRRAAERRGGAFSAFFAILYTLLALPAIGVGIVIEYAGLHWAGGIFTLVVALLALTVLISLSRRRQPVHP